MIDYFVLGAFFLAAILIAINLTLDAIIRNLRRLLPDEWIEEGRPRENLLGFNFEFRPLGTLQRTRLGLTLIFNTPTWAKRSEKLHSLLIQFRALHVVLLIYLAAIAIIGTITSLYPTP